MDTQVATSLPDPARVVVHAVRIGSGQRPRAVPRVGPDGPEFVAGPGAVDFDAPVPRILVDVELPDLDDLVVRAPFGLPEVPADDPVPRLALESTGRGWCMIDRLSPTVVRVIVRPPDAVWHSRDVLIGVGDGVVVLR